MVSTPTAVIEPRLRLGAAAVAGAFLLNGVAFDASARIGLGQPPGKSGAPGGIRTPDHLIRSHHPRTDVLTLVGRLPKRGQLDGGNGTEKRPPQGG